MTKLKEEALGLSVIMEVIRPIRAHITMTPEVRVPSSPSYPPIIPSSMGMALSTVFEQPEQNPSTAHPDPIMPSTPALDFATVQAATLRTRLTSPSPVSACQHALPGIRYRLFRWRRSVKRFAV